MRDLHIQAGTSPPEKIMALGQEFTDYGEVRMESIEGEHGGMFNRCQEFQGVP